MQITLDQTEIKNIICDYLRNQFTFKDSNKLEVNLIAGRTDGMRAVIDITTTPEQVTVKNLIKEPVNSAKDKVKSDLLEEDTESVDVEFDKPIDLDSDPEDIIGTELDLDSSSEDDEEDLFK